MAKLMLGTAGIFLCSSPLLAAERVNCATVTEGDSDSVYCAAHTQAALKAELMRRRKDNADCLAFPHPEENCRKMTTQFEQTQKNWEVYMQDECDFRVGFAGPGKEKEVLDFCHTQLMNSRITDIRNDYQP